MGTNDTTLHYLAYVLNKNCSAQDLQIYTTADQENIGLFHFAYSCFFVAYLGSIFILTMQFSREMHSFWGLKNYYLLEILLDNIFMSIVRLNYKFVMFCIVEL